MSALLLSGLNRPLTFGLGVGAAILPADLVEAIQDFWESAPAVPLAGGLWANQAPPRSEPPLAILEDLGRTEAVGIATDRGARIAVLDGRILLRVFALSRPDARAKSRALARSFELAAAANSLVFAEGRLLSLDRTPLEPAEIDPEPGADGSPVWQSTIEFSYSVIEG